MTTRPLATKIIYLPSYGSLPSVERKRLITNLIADEGAAIPVNRKWQIQLNQDPDLLWLIKRGVLKRVRIGSVQRRQTYLMKA